MSTNATLSRSWQLRQENWQLPLGGAIMGILNTTPDSFSDGGQFNEESAALQQAEKLIEEGADILDIGGESTRPGATAPSLEEEYQRTIPLIKKLRESYPQLRLSIDTRHPSIAQAALEAGADIINDISGLTDPQMRSICAQYQCGIILMHMKGEPQTMQQAPSYSNVVSEVRQFFQECIDAAIKDGIKRQAICLDPGIGFGKTTEHNLQLIKQLDQLRPAGAEQQPMMMALSRKRFMGEILNNPIEGKGTIPTLTMSLLSAEQGADLHRVHEVGPLKAALKLRAALLACPQ